MRPRGSAIAGPCGSARALKFHFGYLRLNWLLFSHNSYSRRGGSFRAFLRSFLGVENTILNYDKYQSGYIIGVGLSGTFGRYSSLSLLKLP